MLLVIAALCIYIFFGNKKEDQQSTQKIEQGQSEYVKPEEPVDRSKNASLKINIRNQAKYSGNYTDQLTFTIDCRAKSYTLNFDVNSLESSSKEIEYNEVYGTLPEPTRIGYKFSGWFTEKENGNQVDENSKMQGADTTIYAHWIPVSYTIKYEGNGAVGSMEESHMTYNSAEALKENTFVNNADGAHFDGWNTTADGSGKDYADRADGSKLTTKDGDTITLYAQWAYEHKVKVEYEDVKGDYPDNEVKTYTYLLRAGKNFSWSKENLPDWQADATSWERQWQTPDPKSYTTDKKSVTTDVLFGFKWSVV